MRIQFQDEVFPAELEEIAKRRKTQGLKAPNQKGPPSVSKGLIGLALSGGGIRSATVSLGVIQSLIKDGKFRLIDYLSTVSGGGYTGSCISSVLNRPGVSDSVFEDSEGKEDTPVVSHLRNSSNYLIPSGALNQMRLPMILLRGILLNLWLIIPPLILAVFFTELLTELWHRVGAPTMSPLIVAAPFVALALLYSPVLRVLGGSFDWRLRNHYENALSALLALSVLALAAVPLFSLVRYCIDNNWGGHISKFFAETSFKAGMIQFGIILGALFIFIFVIRAFKKFPAVARIIINTMVGILGPVIVLGIYLLFCIFFVESPYFNNTISDTTDTEFTTYSAILDHLAENNEASPAADLLTTELRNNHIQIEDHSASSPISVRSLGEFDGSKAWMVVSGEADFVEIREASHHLFAPDKSIFNLHAEWGFYGVGLLILILNLLFFDANVTSTHGFYRDRLSLTFQFVVDEDGVVEANDDQKLTQLNSDGAIAPYHIINTTLNLCGSSDSGLRGRKSDFFTLSKRHCGSEQTGYQRTSIIEETDRRINLGSAMAISAAAAAPNMGAITNHSVVFIMALLNLRLGYWLPNPGYTRSLWRFWKILWPNVGPRYLLREALGRVHAKDTHVNLSDGGHLENTAVYPLLKRRCKLIIAVDAEADPKNTFNGLVDLIRYAKIDLGIRIKIDLQELKADGTGVSENHWTLATIHYGTDQAGVPEVGHLIYLKSSFTGDENEYVKAYRQADPAFPHQTTADQFFDETQFEVYRSLGQHIGRGALNDPAIKKLFS